VFVYSLARERVEPKYVRYWYRTSYYRLDDDDDDFWDLRVISNFDKILNTFLMPKLCLIGRKTCLDYLMLPQTKNRAVGTVSSVLTRLYGTVILTM
jgi:hypothetical protein